MPDMDYPPSEHLEEEVLNEYLDGVLDAAAAQLVAEHLAGCTLCAGQLEALRSVFLALDNLPEAPLGHDLARGVLTKITPPAEIVFSTRARLLLSLQAILAVALVAALWPVIEAGFRSEVYWQAVEAALLAGIQLVNGWQVGWQEMVATLSGKLGFVEQWIQQWETLPFSTVQVAMLLGISGLAWLAANGRLISASQSNKKSDQMKRRKV